MNNADLIELGNRLIPILETLATHFHVKSDQHDILLYEATIIQGKVQYLETGELPPKHLRESVLLGKWGATLLKDPQTWCQEVAPFHQAWKAFSV